MYDHMEIPPAVAAEISQKRQRAWENGLIQGVTWYVNKIMRPTREDSSKVEHFSLNGEDFAAVFERKERSLSETGEYAGNVRLFGETGQLLFQLAFEGYSEDYRPTWAAREPSAQSAVDAFIEGPWTEQFLLYLSALKEKEQLEIEAAERRRQITERDALENLKKKFGVA